MLVKHEPMSGGKTWNMSMPKEMDLNGSETGLVRETMGRDGEKLLTGWARYLASVIGEDA